MSLRTQEKYFKNGASDQLSNTIEKSNKIIAMKNWLWQDASHHWL